MYCRVKKVFFNKGSDTVAKRERSVENEKISSEEIFSLFS